MRKVLIVEDDDYTLNHLKEIIKKNREELMIFTAKSVDQAMQFLNEHTFDMFFFDIGLQGQSGLDLAAVIRKKDYYKLTPIVFITADSSKFKKAVKELHCYDFIEKPFEDTEVCKVLKDIMKGLNKNSDQEYVMPETLTFCYKHVQYSVKISEIIFIESIRKKCIIHTHNDIYEAYLKISDMEEKLAEYHFLRSHRSYIINPRYIKIIDKQTSNSWTVCFENYLYKAYVGNSYKQIISDELNQ